MAGKLLSWRQLWWGHAAFLAALVAAYHNPSLGSFVDRLRKARDSNEVNITAARKIVTIAKAMCRNRQQWILFSAFFLPLPTAARPCQFDQMNDQRAYLTLGAGYLSTVWLLAPLESGEAIVAFCLVVPLVWLSVVDLRQREIPDLAVILVVLCGLVQLWGQPFALSVNALVAGGVVAVLAAGGNWVWRKRGVDVLGLGDVKLIGAGILTVGAPSFWLMILLASVGGLSAALVARTKASEGIPFGPFLAYGLFVTYLISVKTT